MAKKETDQPQNQMEAKLQALRAAMAKIEKDFGKGSVMKLGDQQIDKIDVIPSGSLGLDLALGVGGYPKGRIIEIYGPESSGKTTLAIHAIAEAQKQGGMAAIIDAEHAFDRFYAASLGVDVDNLYISQPDNGEQAVQIADQLLSSDNIQDKHDMHLHQPAAREDRHHVRQSRDHDRWQRPEVLCLCPS